MLLPVKPLLFKAILLLFTCTFSTAEIYSQIIVTNPRPNIYLPSKLVLFRGADNPIMISTGDSKSVKVTVINGTIRKGEEPGLYWITPGYDTAITIVRVKENKKTYEFEFRHWLLPMPRIEFNGHRNMDGMITNFGTTRGIIAYLKDFNFHVPFTVDSFTVTFSDSAGSQTHTNIGSDWDQESIKQRRKAKSGTMITVKYIYISAQKEKFFFEKGPSYLIQY